jgi:hypothetical protein
MNAILQDMSTMNPMAEKKLTWYCLMYPAFLCDCEALKLAELANSCICRTTAWRPAARFGVPIYCPLACSAS